VNSICSGLTYEDVNEHHVVLRGERHIQRLVLKERNAQNKLRNVYIKESGQQGVRSRRARRVYYTTSLEHETQLESGGRA